MFLIDTNVLSELERRRPEPAVVNWIRSAPQELLYVSVITLAELVLGAKGHDEPARRARLQRWLDDEIRPWINEGLTPVTTEIAEKAGAMAAARKLAGRPITFQDSLIASTAVHHRFVVVSRNERDFKGFGLQIINPWIEAEPRHI